MASTAQNSALNPSLIGRYFVVFIRLYLGAWMLLNGLNHFIAIFPQPMGGPLKSSQLMVTLIETGLFDLVKSTEILVGLMLLFDVFVPVALVMAMPVSMVVWYNHAILSGKPFDFSMGIGCLVWNIFLLFAYISYFLPMLRARAEIGTFADLKRLRELLIFSTTNEKPESRHRAGIVVAALILTAILAYRLHPRTEQSPGAGMTPTMIVTQYLKMAFDEGKRTEAENMFFSPELASRDKALLVPKDGRPEKSKILNIIAQGPKVAVYHVISSDSGAGDLKAVDIYRVEKNRISDHVRVSASANE